MNPVFANSAIVSTPEWLVLKGGGRQTVRLKVRYGIFRHPDIGLMLIDTGYGERGRRLRGDSVAAPGEAPPSGLPGISPTRRENSQWHADCPKQTSAGHAKAACGETVPQPLSPVVGEMPGRAERGVTSASPSAVTSIPRRSLTLRLYDTLLRAELLPDSLPAITLPRLGARLQDVRAIVVTHFHADHVAALDLFPQARIFARRSVLDGILTRSTWQNLRHGIFRELLPADLPERITDIDTLPQRAAPLGLGAGYDLLGDGSLLAIDLPGHAEGHFGVCFTGPPVPLLYAVDVQWLPDALAPARAPGFPASLVADSRRDVADSARRVAAFREAGGDVLLCHDPADSPYDLPGTSR